MADIQTNPSDDKHDANKSMSSDTHSSVGAALRTQRERERKVVRVSGIGIAANVVLAAFKAAVGFISGSIAIVLDAVNNLSDAASSLITIVGTKLASKQADREHPYGFGRIEYLMTIIIAALVLWAGATSLNESVRRILSPEPASYTASALLIVAVAVVVKLVLGRYVGKQGQALGSDSLVASGTDATMDAALSASTLAAAFVQIIWHVSIEAWVGALISVVIIKAGIDILRETVDKLLGERLDPDLSHTIKHEVESVDGVLGAYDLMLGDYGPERLMGSVHVEVQDTTTAAQIDKLTREIQKRVHSKTGVILHTVGVYSHNSCGDVSELEALITRTIKAHPEAKEVHGFYADMQNRTCRADIIISYDVANRSALYQRICKEVQAVAAPYKVELTLDADVSDLCIKVSRAYERDECCG